MRMTSRTFFLRASLLSAACLALVASTRIFAQPAPQKPVQAPQPAAEQASASLIERGEYLTTSVAMCVQCHSGRDENGNIIESARFRGGAIPVTSPYRNQSWAAIAPSLAGLPGFTDEQVVSLLTTGNMGDARPSPRRPMPPFRMNKADAEAVVAYLRSR
jgi:mono/diheme cytochrome c family protein